MNRIKEVLVEKGIKQTWLAEQLGKSFSVVNSYVCNRRQPSLEVHNKYRLGRGRRNSNRYNGGCYFCYYKK